MNTFAKIMIGWVIWTVGVLFYAHLATNAPPPIHEPNSLVEFAYGAMMASYLVGVPILTIIWITEGKP